MLTLNRKGSYPPPAILPTYARMLLLTPFAMVSRIRSGFRSRGNRGDANTASLTALVLHSLWAPDQLRTRNFGLMPSEMSPSCFNRLTMKPTKGVSPAGVYQAEVDGTNRVILPASNSRGALLTPDGRLFPRALASADSFRHVRLDGTSPFLEVRPLFLKSLPSCGEVQFMDAPLYVTFDVGCSLFGPRSGIAIRHVHRLLGG